MQISKNNKQAVYLICVDQNSINHRVKLILSLKKSVYKMILVTQKGTIQDKENLIVGASPNPFGIFRLLGLHSHKAVQRRPAVFLIFIEIKHIPATDIVRH